jgi:hypothetical protein
MEICTKCTKKSTVRVATVHVEPATLSCVYRLISLFCYILYKFRLHFNFCMAVEDDMSYVIIYIYIVNELQIKVGNMITTHQINPLVTHEIKTPHIHSPIPFHHPTP